MRTPIRTPKKNGVHTACRRAGVQSLHACLEGMQSLHACLEGVYQSSMANQLNACTSSNDHFHAPLRRSPNSSSPPLFPLLLNCPTAQRRAGLFPSPAGATAAAQRGLIKFAWVPAPELKRANEP
ncbi:hypothetical protein PCANC_27220 [Puccinia coronata f. sp. avenae]|uniref:Uncharacterized protein n=1 Tax=Puccinia coronata f. sp. avenae TaxID=200324 RepID=A0A2N5TKS7_9BASI|nr:hypothetical protein PCANC_27220 [Puccinia coronata f. sp. avenae]